jgi:hypothetical protein
MASGVDTPLSTCSHVLDRGAQAGVQTAACGDATLPQQEKGTRQMSKEWSKDNQPHLHKGKVILAAMYLRGVRDLAVA